jgi:hypothetical protein
MSTLTYSNSNLVPASSPQSTQRWMSLWRTLCAMLIASRQRQTEREIAAYLARHGGQLSDQLERDIMCRLDSSRHLTN